MSGVPDPSAGSLPARQTDPDAWKQYLEERDDE